MQYRRKFKNWRRRICGNTTNNKQTNKRAGHCSIYRNSMFRGVTQLCLPTKNSCVLSGPGDGHRQPPSLCTLCLHKGHKTVAHFQNVRVCSTFKRTHLPHLYFRLYNFDPSTLLPLFRPYTVARTMLPLHSTQ